MLRGLFSIKPPPRFLFSSPFKSSPFPPPPQKRPFYSSQNRRIPQKETKLTPLSNPRNHLQNIKEFGKDKWEKTHWLKRNFALLLGGLGVWWYFSHFDRVPVSGRWRYIAFSLESEMALGKSSYESLLIQHKTTMLSSNHEHTRKVEEIGRKLIATSPTLEERNYDWEFHVINEPIVNAFVLPNGKCFVYTGLLDLCHSEDELAIIMGHEVAHVVARHVGERLSKKILRIVVSLAMVLFLGIEVDLDILNQGGEFALGLPQSRRNETEADQIGLILAKRANYDVMAAVTIWEKMTEGGKSQFDLLSTHPADKKRIKNIKQMIQKMKQKPQLLYQNKV